MPELSSAELLLRLALAAALGGAVGAERELRDREAGFRTHLLVALGAALFTLVSAYAWSGWSFLGAGAIIRHGFSVRGLTTAATLWAVAAIGMAAGAGYYAAAVATTALVLIGLWPLRFVSHRLFSRLRREHGQLVVELRPGAGAAAVLAPLERTGARVRTLDFDEVEGKRRVQASLELRPGASRTALVSKFLDGEEVLGAEWTD